MSLQISQSLLFGVSEGPGQPRKSDLGFSFSDSLLFGHATSGKPDDTGDIGDAFDISPASAAAKQFKLLDGQSLTLRPRPMQSGSEADALSGLAGSFVDMDALFNEIEVQKQVKEISKLGKSGESAEPKVRRSSKHSQVWTEKYRPQLFLDMCPAGNDRQFRLILKWLKKWSNLVFKETNEYGNGDSVDLLGRPLRKILLIHGPPGIGKTALVHVLTKSFGYTLQELNAGNSVDTQTQTNGDGSSTTSRLLKLRINNAMTVNSLLGKPYCLLIDEIDLSLNSHEIVNVLTGMILADKRDSNPNRTSDKKPFLINRPIICIANDIYSRDSSNSGPNGSAMDKLRGLCEIVQLRKPQISSENGNASTTIKTFLAQVNKREKLGLDSSQLGEIVKMCDCDIRACINQLQLSRKLPFLTAASNGGNDMDLVKDTSMTWYSMVDMLFMRDAQVSREEGFARLIQTLISGSGRSALSNNLIMTKVMRGCFQRYLDVVHYENNSLDKPCELSDWMYFYDQAGDAYDGVYGGFTGIKIWSIFSEINLRTRQLPLLLPESKRLNFETFDARRQNLAMAKRLGDTLPPQAKQSLGGTPEIMATAIIPFLAHMFNPSLSSKLFLGLSAAEQETVVKLTSLMKGLDITLETERDLETSLSTLKFSPDWDPLLTYETEFAPLRAEAVKTRIQTKRQLLFPLLEQSIDRPSQPAPGNAKRDLLEPNQPSRSVKRARMGNPIDFFKNQYLNVATQTNVKAQEDEPGTTERTRIWIKYHEGFSNAVKKNIGWKDLWTQQC